MIVGVAKGQRRLVAEIDEKLYTKLAILAARKGKKMKPLVIEAVEDLLEKYPENEYK